MRTPPRKKSQVFLVAEGTGCKRPGSNMETLERIQPNRQVMAFILLVFLSQARSEPIRYSVLEETESGSFVAHLSKDLGLGIGELAAQVGPGGV